MKNRIKSFALMIGFTLVAIFFLMQPAIAEVCHSDSQCGADGLFCNGLEKCLPDDPMADVRGCVRGIWPRSVNRDQSRGRRIGFFDHTICAPDSNPYTRDYCDEDNDRCVHESEDNDGDGHASLRTSGDDCNDNDATTFPGNVEICDARGHDEDCDPTTVGNKDSDGDGYNDSKCFNTGADGRRTYDTRRH